MKMLHFFHRYSMPVLLSLALVFSQALGFKHGLDHLQFKSEQVNISFIDQQVVADSAQTSFEQQPQNLHNCIVLDALTLAAFALTAAYAAALLNFLKQVKSERLKQSVSLKFASYYSSRAPPYIH